MDFTLAFELVYRNLHFRPLVRWSQFQFVQSRFLVVAYLVSKLLCFLWNSFTFAQFIYAYTQAVNTAFLLLPKNS